jgi:hypothetical protein
MCSWFPVGVRISSRATGKAGVAACKRLDRVLAPGPIQPPPRSERSRLLARCAQFTGQMGGGCGTPRNGSGWTVTRKRLRMVQPTLVAPNLTQPSPFLRSELSGLWSISTGWMGRASLYPLE